MSAALIAFPIFEHAMAILTPKPPKSERRIIPNWRTTDAEPKLPKPKEPQKFLDELKHRDLTPKEAQTLRLKYVTAEQAAKLGFQLAQDGTLIPYFNAEGKPTGFQRIRYFDVKVCGFTGKKGPKYNQVPGTGNHLYLPPLLEWQKIAPATDVPLIITEGEYKAITAAKNNLPTIGLGGVWNFKNANNRHLIEFKEFNWDKRRVYICYDSDAAQKWQVALAENALAHELLNLGAMPYILRLPQEGDDKTGLDDFLLAKGRAAFDKILCAAQQFEPAQELFKFNEEVIYVRDPGFIYIPASGLDEDRRISPDAFVKHAYSNRIYFENVPSGDGTRRQKKYAAKEWLDWPYRNEASKLTYVPGAESGMDGCINTWPGWGCEPKRGSVKPWTDLLTHLFRNAPPEDLRHAEQWMAYPLQHPGAKLKTALVIWGPQGTGKSMVGYSLGRIYGKNFCELQQGDLSADFNDWADRRQFIMGSEITGGENRKKIADHIKSLITREKIRVNTKHVKAFYIPDCINYYFTSNHEEAFFLENDDRRFFIHEADVAPLPPEFYERYMHWLDHEDGAAHLFHHLMNVDLTGFKPNAPAPMTEAKQENIDGGLSPEQQFANAAFEEPALWLGRFKLMTSKEVCVKFGVWFAQVYPAGASQRRRTKPQSVTRALRKYFTQWKGGNGKRGQPVKELKSRLLINELDKNEIARMNKLNEEQILAKYRAERTPKEEEKTV